MKTSEYKFQFTDGTYETTYATGYGDAFVLALAKRVNDGLDRSVTKAYVMNSDGRPERLHFEFSYKV